MSTPGRRKSTSVGICASWYAVIDAAAASSAARTAAGTRALAVRNSLGSTWVETRSTPSKRRVKSTRAASPRAFTAARISRTASTGPSDGAAGRGSRSATSPVKPRRSILVSTRTRYRPGSVAPAAIRARLRAMNSDAAELSSLTTVVADVAARIGKIAERRGIDPDDPLVGRLHEIERALVTAERRLRSTARELD